MTTQGKNSKKTGKASSSPKKRVTAKVAPKPAAVKSTGIAKKTAKSAAKTAVTKSTTKDVVKSSVKSAAKTLVKAPVKKTVAATKKSTAKPSVKKTVKPTPKSLAKPASKVARDMHKCAKAKSVASKSVKSVSVPEKKSSAHSKVTVRGKTTAKALTPAQPVVKPTVAEVTKQTPPPAKSQDKATASERRKLLDEMLRSLLDRREAVRQSLDGNRQDERLQATSGDIADIASGYSETEILFQLAEAGSKELAEIDRAIRRMEEGDYGTCESCGKDIPIPRLKILPFASKCIQCQESEEQSRSSGYYFGD